MMTGHPISEDDLLAYVDDQLDPVRRAEVAAYLGERPRLAARVAADQAMAAALRAALDPVMAEPLPPTLIPAAVLARHRAGRRQRPWRLVGQAVAALLLLAVGGVGGWSWRGMAPPVSALPGALALGQEAAVSYGVYAPDAAESLEIIADHADLGRWASERLHRPVTVPDLEPAGYRLLGGRLVATPNGPAGLFLYQDEGGNRLAVMTRAMRVRGDARMTAVTPPVGDSTAVAGYSWADDGMGYSLVGSAQTHALHPLADDARRQIRAAIPRAS